MNQSQNDKELTEQPPSQQNDGDGGKESPPKSSMADGALGGILPHSISGCGCLSALGLYYLYGLSLLNDIKWPEDWKAVLAYSLGPIAWPVMLSGWDGNPLNQTLLAVAGLVAYALLLIRLFTATSRKTICFSMLGLFLLFLASLGGCGQSLDRSLK